jgi:hypothetical protein
MKHDREFLQSRKIAELEERLRASRQRFDGLQDDLRRYLREVDRNPPLVPAGTPHSELVVLIGKIGRMRALGWALEEKWR